MSHRVDFHNISTAGLESSPVAAGLAGLRANEARYLMNKYNHPLVFSPIYESPEILQYVNHILLQERKILLSAQPLEVAQFTVSNIKMTYIVYQDGLILNVMYSLDDPKKRAVGFKLTEGMEIPTELAEKFKFARQKSKLAGTIRGSFFIIREEYE